ncbi:MAG: 30S ribosomal protein S6 [Thermoflexibacter sp.]|jgi:small subunit ribosomal protein S6|nr:30S ribosomal protein S6 [Thermoflexibacter sp.]
MTGYHYETVFIINPVLSEKEAKDTVQKFKDVLTHQGADVYHTEEWGLKKLAYSIQHKNTGFYALMEFRGNKDSVKALEIEFRRDERVMRFLTTALDKYALEYNERRRRGEFNKGKDSATNPKSKKDESGEG